MHFQQLTDRLRALQKLIQELSEENYRRPSALLGGASIGKHVRHILEVLQCLKEGYAQGIVNYDLRRRDASLENHPSDAIDLIGNLLDSLYLENKPITMAFAEESIVTVPSSYLREISYNVEHTVHHFAMIHVALREMNLDLVEDDFSKAASTIRFHRSSG